MARHKIPGLIFGDRNNNPEPKDIPEDHSYDSAADSNYEPEDPNGDLVDDEPHDDNEPHGQTPNTRDKVLTVATNEQLLEEASHTSDDSSSSDKSDSSSVSIVLKDNKCSGASIGENSKNSGASMGKAGTLD